MNKDIDQKMQAMLDAHNVAFGEMRHATVDMGQATTAMMRAVVHMSAAVDHMGQAIDAAQLANQAAIDVLAIMRRADNG